jgi:nitrite reductase/ring-hydroxylating ferredoxin subunit
MSESMEHPKAPRFRQPLTRREKWRADFPVDEAKDHFVARRDFTKFLILISGGFTLGQLWIGFSSLFRRPNGSREGLRIAGKSDLPIGGSLLFHFPTDKDSCVLVRLGAEEFVAFSTRCTHLLCPVGPRVEKGSFHCPCHNGWFDIRSGRRTAGPPERPLPRVRLETRGQDIFAVAMEPTTV